MELCCVQRALYRPAKMGQQSEPIAVRIDTAGWMFTDGSGQPIHMPSRKRSRTHRSPRRRAGHPTARPAPHTERCYQGRVPVKVVSERLGHATPAFTIDTYQHVLPGMQAAAARVFEQIVARVVPPSPDSREKTRLKHRRNTAWQW